MLVFPSMIADAAERAGMAVPPDPEDFDREKFPHFAVYCSVQLGRPIQWGEHWGNAAVVAKVPAVATREVTLEKLIAQGLRFQS